MRAEAAGRAVPGASPQSRSPHLVADLDDLDKDGEWQAEENVAHEGPPVAKLPVDGEGGDVTLPRGLVHVHWAEGEKGLFPEQFCLGRHPTASPEFELSSPGAALTS